MRYATLNQSDFSISLSLVGYYIAMVSHILTILQDLDAGHHRY